MPPNALRAKQDVQHMMERLQQTNALESEAHTARPPLRTRRRTTEETASPHDGLTMAHVMNDLIEYKCCHLGTLHSRDTQSGDSIGG